MTLTLINPTSPDAQTETVTGMEVCIPCASLIATGTDIDRHGGRWQTTSTPPAYEVTHCDLCHSPVGADRVSASVAFFCID